MGNPQKENGFTPIANELLEQLVKLRIPASEKDMLFFVIRKTYGYQKKEDRISLTQFEKGTLLSRVTVVKALKNLISRNILVKSGLLFKFNKQYNSWVVNAGILVKSENIFGKGGYTKSGKGGYTYKRKKKTKEISNSKELGLLTKNNKMDIDYETGEVINERPKSYKREDVIKLALLFDELASKEAKCKIITPSSYYIVLNAMNKHKLKIKGIAKIYQEWFEDPKIKKEDKVKLSWCLGKNNINSFKVKHNG